MLVLNIESSTYITIHVTGKYFQVIISNLRMTKKINIKPNRIIILAMLYFYDFQNRESYNFQL